MRNFREVCFTLSRGVIRGLLSVYDTRTILFNSYEIAGVVCQWFKHISYTLDREREWNGAISKLG